MEPLTRLKEAAVSVANGNYEIKVFKPWFYRVAKNHCLQLLRKENKEITLDYTVNVMESDEFLHLLSEEESSEEQLKALHHCLEKLPEEQRTSIDSKKASRHSGYEEGAGYDGDSEDYRDRQSKRIGYRRR